MCETPICDYCLMIIFDLAYEFAPGIDKVNFSPSLPMKGFSYIRFITVKEHLTMQKQYHFPPNKCITTTVKHPTQVSWELTPISD